MKRNISRRRFLATSSLAGFGLAPGAAERARALEPQGERAPRPGIPLKVATCNPLLRTPLSLIIDDSCPLLNMAYYWVKQRHEWRIRHRPDSRPSGWEIHYDKLDGMPQTIPASFAAQWGEWCAAEGIRGKFSMVPFPAGMGRIDQSFPGFPEQELRDWLRVTREIIQPIFDITPEMLTHTRVVNLKNWRLTGEWEQVEWVDPPPERLADYVAAAMQLLKNAGLDCAGVTSPGAFGRNKESEYARAVLEASMRIYGNPRPLYFLWLWTDRMPEVPLWHVQKETGAAVASIVGCAGDWFGQTGFDRADADLFITEDLGGGRLPAVLEQERPCILLGHWPCFFVNDQVGFSVLKTVKRRLDSLDPDKTKTVWMKNSEIGHYWMARKLSDITESGGGVRILTRYPAVDFTLSLDLPARRVLLRGDDLRQVHSRRDFRSGTFLVEGKHTYVAFDLARGETDLSLTA